MSEQDVQKAPPKGVAPVACATQDSRCPSCSSRIIVLGLIVAVLLSVIIVTFQQKDNTEGRLNVSRAEQNVKHVDPR